MRVNLSEASAAQVLQPNEARSELTHRLIERFGELMTYEQLAQLLHWHPISLHAFVTRRESPFSSALWAARVKLGRRVYFRSAQIAALVWRDVEDRLHE